MLKSAIEIAVDDGITTISINRPNARNALDVRSARELHAAFIGFDQDDSSAVAVLHGQHGNFCAGADLKEVATGAVYDAWAGSLTGMLGAPLSKPIIAAVEGHAVAGGLGIALYCDIRVADETAMFGVYCRRFGVPMSDGTTVRLPRLIGESRAMNMMLTGRGVDAREALHIGLVSAVAAPNEALATATAMARDIARFPQLAMRSDRRSLLESQGLEIADALKNEAKHAEAAKHESAATGASRFADGAGRHGTATS
jgi:enoyl-CoA hydratase